MYIYTSSVSLYDNIEDDNLEVRCDKDSNFEFGRSHLLDSDRGIVNTSLYTIFIPHIALNADV